MLKRHVSGVVLIIGRTRIFLETGEFLTSLHLRFDYSSEVPSGKDTVMRDPVVKSVRLEIVIVLEV